jgi:hypothetical protein
MERCGEGKREREREGVYIGILGTYLISPTVGGEFPSYCLGGLPSANATPKQCRAALRTAIGLSDAMPCREFHSLFS